MNGASGAAILSVSHLTVAVADREAFRDISFTLDRGGVYALMGPNGGGKTSLAMFLMGSTQYLVHPKRGTEVLFDGKDLLAMKPNERAKVGLYVSWQQPIAIPGVSVFSLAKASYENVVGAIDSVVAFKTRVEELLTRVGLPATYVSRSVNDGFSGGERKRLELFQLLLLQPKLAILDELDSGLDQAGRALLTSVVAELSRAGTTFLIISHYNELLRNLSISNTWELEDGQLHARLS